MTDGPPGIRRGEYALRGDYHRNVDANWSYYPTYVAKLAYVRRYLDQIPDGTRVLDAGCGEGVLVDEYRPRLNIVGIDQDYGAPHVTRASLLSLPFASDAFPHVLCLDVLEHLRQPDQLPALRELSRVLRPDGRLLVSVPNLAHLQSRLHFLVTGRFIRTASEEKHPGDRPASEFVRLFDSAGFVVLERKGIFPTVPLLARWIRRRPARLEPLHRFLTAALPVPGWCFLNLFVLEKRHA